MPQKFVSLVEHPDAELVIGIVSPLGVERDRFVSHIQDELRAFGYSADVIQLSKFLKRLEPSDGFWNLVETPEAARLESYMTAGDLFRRGSSKNEILALMAASEIASKRPSTDPVLKRRAHIVVSLKHPDEVLALRDVYDAGFFLIGLYTPESERLRYLTEVKGLSEFDAKRLMHRDQEEPVEHGQQSRDAFQLSDVFIRIDSDLVRNDGVSRFFDLVFGNPKITPTQDEHAMFLAYAAACRSAALGRQVGAVVVSAEGDILAVGANDVPRFGGGQYWPGADDARDHQRGHDSNATQRDEIVTDIVDRLTRDGVIKATDRDRLNLAEKAIRESRLIDITEYGREVHAEMEALLSCARSGGQTRLGTLFTTTFPCHNCAKHVVGAGLARVVFVEPYPKSKAVDLHSDALTLEESEKGRKVLFEPFVGVGPRRYLDLFSIRLGTGSPLHRKEGKRVTPWRRDGARPRVQMRPMSYLQKEHAAQSVVKALRGKGDQPKGEEE